MTFAKFAIDSRLYSDDVTEVDKGSEIQYFQTHAHRKQRCDLHWMQKRTSILLCMMF